MLLCFVPLIFFSDAAAASKLLCLPLLPSLSLSLFYVRFPGMHCIAMFHRRVSDRVCCDGTQDVRSAVEERERAYAELGEARRALNASIEAQKR